MSEEVLRRYASLHRLVFHLLNVSIREKNDIEANKYAQTSQMGSGQAKFTNLPML
jgi:hypothetical protein